MSADVGNPGGPPPAPQRSPLRSDHKHYLGDGVYVRQGRAPNEIIMTTEDGISETNVIVLDESILISLVLWLDARTAEREIARGDN